MARPRSPVGADLALGAAVVGSAAWVGAGYSRGDLLAMTVGGCLAVVSLAAMVWWMDRSDG